MPCGISRRLAASREEHPEIAALCGPKVAITRLVQELLPVFFSAAVEALVRPSVEGDASPERCPCAPRATALASTSTLQLFGCCRAKVGLLVLRSRAGCSELKWFLVVLSMTDPSFVGCRLKNPNLHDEMPLVWMEHGFLETAMQTSRTLAGSLRCSLYTLQDSGKCGKNGQGETLQLSEPCTPSFEERLQALRVGCVVE